MNELKIGPDVVVVDLEIAVDVTPPLSFDRPWEMQMAVACTYADAHGYRDWIGETAVPSLLRYLTAFARVVGFNHIKFDYGVMDGALTRGFEKGQDAARKAISSVLDLSDRDPAPGMVATLLRTKSIDLHMDISSYLDGLKQSRVGRRANLDRVAKATLPSGKESDRFHGGAEAPKAWRERKALEVIAYCRKDVGCTAGIYSHLNDGGKLFIMDWPQPGKNDLGGPVVLRPR